MDRIQCTLPEINSSPLKVMVSNRNLLFHGSIFSGENVSFREGMKLAQASFNFSMVTKKDLGPSLAMHPWLFFGGDVNHQDSRLCLHPFRPYTPYQKTPKTHRVGKMLEMDSPKTNISPEKSWLEDYFPFEMVPF